MAGGALQQEVDDVWQPEDVKNTRYSEQDHGIALVGAGLHLPWLPTLDVEAGFPLTNLLCVLLADAEDVEVGEAHREDGRGIQHHHDEEGEVGVRGPGLGAPPEHISVIARLAPVEEGRKENQSGVEPDHENAHAESAGCDQGIIGQGFSDGNVPIDADAGQRGHGYTLQHGYYEAKYLTGQSLLHGKWVVEEREGGDQTAYPNQEVSIGHSLDKITGRMVIQQRCTMEHKYHHDIARDNQSS